MKTPHKKPRPRFRRPWFYTGYLDKKLELKTNMETKDIM